MHVCLLDACPLTGRLSPAPPDSGVCLSQSQPGDGDTRFLPGAAASWGLAPKDTVLGALRGPGQGQGVGVDVEAAWGWASLEAVRRALGDFDVLVLGAHGGVEGGEEGSGGEAFLALEGGRGAAERVGPREMREALRGVRARAQVVVLGACHSEDVAREVAAVDGVAFVVAARRGKEVQNRVCEALVASLLSDLLLRPDVSMQQAFERAVQAICSLSCLADDASRERQRHKFVLLQGTVPLTLKRPAAPGKLNIWPTVRSRPRKCLTHVHRSPPLVGRDMVLRGAVNFLTSPRSRAVAVASPEVGMGASRIVAETCDYLLEREWVGNVFVVQGNDGTAVLDCPQLRHHAGAATQLDTTFLCSPADSPVFDLYVADFPRLDVNKILSWFERLLAVHRGGGDDRPVKLLMVAHVHPHAVNGGLQDLVQRDVCVVPLPPLTDPDADALLMEAGFGDEVLGADLCGVLQHGQGNPKLLMEHARAVASARTLASHQRQSFVVAAGAAPASRGSLGGGSSNGSLDLLFQRYEAHGTEVSPVTRLVRALSSGSSSSTSAAASASASASVGNVAVVGWKAFAATLQQIFAAQVYSGASAFEWCGHTVRCLSDADLLVVQHKLLERNEHHQLAGSASMAGGIVIAPDTVRVVWREWLAPTIRTLHQVEKYWTRNQIHGFATRESIEAQLQDQAPGTFVIRTSDSEPGFLVVSYVTATATVNHVLISVLSLDGRVSVPYKSGCEVRLFPNLSRFVLDSRVLQFVVGGGVSGSGSGSGPGAAPQPQPKEEVFGRRGGW